jgi:hypothetical protein
VDYGGLKAENFDSISFDNGVNDLTARRLEISRQFSTLVAKNFKYISRSVGVAKR